jgi:hypothetical protein
MSRPDVSLKPGGGVDDEVLQAVPFVVRCSDQPLLPVKTGLIDEVVETGQLLVAAAHVSGTGASRWRLSDARW